jgi:phosphocarrier protein FPr
MIGLVIVSHSATLAEGVCELAAQVAHGKLRIAPAGGGPGPEPAIGTDVSRVLRAIESVYSEDGVLVLTDLGSAVLSAETAIECLDEAKRPFVRLSNASLVEGAVKAAALAGAGATLDEIALEERSLQDDAPQPASGETAHAALRNPLGLHARPAAALVRIARKHKARITMRNATTGRGPVDATSINGLLGLTARRGHSLEITAGGEASREALAEIARFLESGCGEMEMEVPPVITSAPASGSAASGGIAIGPLFKLRPQPVKAAGEAPGDPAAEEARLTRAIGAAQTETRELYQWARAHAGEAEAAIFDAQLLFLEDPELIGPALRCIREERRTADFAWEAASNRLADRLDALDDPYLRARAADMRDVAARVMRKTAGRSALLAPERPSIVAAHDLTPSEVKELHRHEVLGLCLESGSASAHSVILARAMGIPAVVGLGPGLWQVADGTMVAVDGDRGTISVQPGDEQIRELENHRRSWLETRHLAEAIRHNPACTRDGRRIRVFANINSVEESAAAVEFGAEGVGVLRTEFLFLERKEPPNEDEQAAAYAAIAESLDGRPLVIRTLDIGGDKNVPYIEIAQEANPFLGWRGIRLTLDRRDLLRTQLAAILRAGGDILLPMVSSLAELREAKAVLAEACGDLEREGRPYRKSARLGVMIETPAAVAIADQLAREAAFFSLGTNDLIQYVMVADRTNPRVASKADPYQPAVLRMMAQAATAAREAGIEIALCGELAADTRATPLLLGLGFEELSLSAPLIPQIKQAIAGWDAAEARELAGRALRLDSAESVRELLQRPATF